MKVPGIQAKHAIITPNCRSVQGGSLHAFREACRRLEEEYMTILQMREDRDSVDFHVILSVEKRDA